MDEIFITLDRLTPHGVSLLKETYTNNSLVNRERTAYINDTRGRLEVAQNVEEPHKTAIFTVWGVQEEE